MDNNLFMVTWLAVAAHIMSRKSISGFVTRRFCDLVRLHFNEAFWLTPGRGRAVSLCSCGGVGP